MTAPIKAKIRVGDILQFGHGGDAVGDMTIKAIVPYFGALQFGHGGDAVGDSTHPLVPGPVRATFNSATAVTPWVTAAS